MKDFQLIVLGVSSGLGVSLFPFRKNLIGNIEPRPIFHTPKNEIWELNFSSIPLWKKPPDKFPKSDLIISSPDCGAGSILRLSVAKQYGNHKENRSLALFFEAIDESKPKFFLFENLDGLFKSFPESEFRAAVKNYRLIIHNESVAAWGNSQITRKRLVIVGIRKDLPKKYLKFFRKLYYTKDEYTNLRKCGELYGDLAGTDISGNVRENLNDVVTLFGGFKISLRDIQSGWKANKGSKRWKVVGRKFSTAPGVYRNLKNDFPSTARKANRQFDHTGLTLTPRQLARIQGIPDDFQLYIDPEKPNYWINKCRTVVTKTPPYEISLWMYKCLKKLNNRYDI